MFYVVNFSQFSCESSIFPNFGQGHFPKIAGKGPGTLFTLVKIERIPGVYSVIDEPFKDHLHK